MEDLIYISLHFYFKIRQNFKCGTNDKTHMSFDLFCTCTIILFNCHHHRQRNNLPQKKREEYIISLRMCVCNL